MTQREADEFLKQHLLNTRWTEEQAAKVGTVYRGPADFVLQHGTFYTPTKCPSGIPQGAPNCCYGNAILLAMMYDNLYYVEGFALTQDGMVFHHGWNRTDSWNLVDNTWTGAFLPEHNAYIQTGIAYLGVTFNVGRADHATWHDDGTVLDNWKREWPVLRQRWQHDEPLSYPTPEWPPTRPARIMLEAKRQGWTPQKVQTTLGPEAAPDFTPGKTHEPE